MVYLKNDIDKLLEIRYKVIGSYPKSIFNIGEIVIGENLSADLNSEKYSDFPNIFQKLRWFDEIDPEINPDNLPKYFKDVNNNLTYIASKHFYQGFISSYGSFIQYYKVEPITLEMFDWLND